MEKKRLECVDLRYEVGGRSLFDGLSFTAEAGDILWIKGKNGAGKSTLLRLIAGIIRPDSGRILWPRPRHETVYLGHKPAIKHAFSVYEMLAFWASLYDSTQLLNAAIQYFELEPFLELPCDHLSAGWRQKLALSRLILQPAILWLLDEPASHLDDHGVELLQALISSRKEQGGIILLAMHGNIQNKDIKEININ